jgi:N-acetylglucosamine malate deacetylase 2
MPSNPSRIWARPADLRTGLPSRGQNSLRVLLLAAHPDDETIGASVVLARVRDATVVFLTDGAPRARRLRSADVTGSRQAYAQTRWREAVAALALAGLPRSRVLSLEGIDQEASEEIPRLVRELTKLLVALQPDVMITHPYEGGHPDHDAAALVASLAVTSLKRRRLRAPEVLEMTSYHRREGHCVTGEFLPPDAGDQTQTPQLVVELRLKERRRKRQMFACYVSQQRILENFSTTTERFRPAPRYDFRKPPHPGKLWYECLGWPMSGKHWRELALQARKL